jgi:golgi-specific brefeldin A-resistance guanine nucleotide exchange factor 1
VEKVFASLNVLSSLPQETLMNVAEQLMAGMLLLIKTDPSIVLRYSKWETILHLLSSTSMHPDAAKYSYEASCILVNESPDSNVSIDNFGECVDLLISFSVAAGGVLAGETRVNGVAMDSTNANSTPGSKG